MLVARTRNLFLALSICAITLALFPQPGNAQFGGIFSHNATNTVDLDLFDISNCGALPGLDDEDSPAPVICQFLLDDLLDQLVEAESFLDQVFQGYRTDIPRFLSRRLSEPVKLHVVVDAIDGAGGILAQAGPDTFIQLQPNPFLRLPGGYRAWAIPRTGTITLDIDDIIGLVLSDEMVNVVVHESFHALGHPSMFLASNLNGPVSNFGQVNFVGDPNGINNVGFGLTEFRSESANPLATFIPLSQNDGGAHLSNFEPAFVRLGQGYQEVFIFTAAPVGIRSIMSRSLRGMFADLAYKVKGVNSAGFIDIDGDGAEDEPLVVNPSLPGDP